MEQPIVVSNATPLIALAWLERLDLRIAIFGVVHIPEEVQREIAYDPGSVVEISRAQVVCAGTRGGRVLTTRGDVGHHVRGKVVSSRILRQVR